MRRHEDVLTVIGFIAGIIVLLSLIGWGGWFWLVKDHNAERGVAIPAVPPGEAGVDGTVPAHDHTEWSEGGPLVNALINRFQEGIVRNLREPRPTSGTCDITALTRPQVFHCDISYGDDVFSYRVDATEVRTVPRNSILGGVEDQVTYEASRTDGRSAIARALVESDFARNKQLKDNLRCDADIPELKIYDSEDVDTGYHCYYNDPGQFGRTVVLDVVTRDDGLRGTFRICLGDPFLQFLMPWYC